MSYCTCHSEYSSRNGCICCHPEWYKYERDYYCETEEQFIERTKPKVTKRFTLIDEKLEQYMKDRFPVGSHFLLPRSDTGYVVLQHIRINVTPEWYQDGPVEFFSPGVLVVPPCLCFGWHYIDNKPDEIKEDFLQEPEKFDMGTLAEAIPENKGQGPSEWFLAAKEYWDKGTK